MSDEIKIRLEWWKLILGSVVAVVVVLVPLVWTFIASEEAPQFVLSTPIFTADTNLKIYAKNNAAQKEQDLHIEWDSLEFQYGGKFSMSGGVEFSWEFTPNELFKDNEVLQSGPHSIRFSFQNSEYSDQQFPVSSKILLQSVG